MLETTFSIIKPDATKRNLVGKIVSRFEEEGLYVRAMKMKLLSKSEAEGFYAEHKSRPFFNDLVSFMTSGPVILMALQGEGAVLRNRDIMGATNPADAAEGTLRKLYAESIEANSVHGSDSAESAARELAYFFSGIELYN